MNKNRVAHHMFYEGIFWIKLRIVAFNLFIFLYAIWVTYLMIIEITTHRVFGVASWRKFKDQSTMHWFNIL